MFRHEDNDPTVPLDDRAGRLKGETAVVRGFRAELGLHPERVRLSGGPGGTAPGCHGHPRSPCCRVAFRRSGRREAAQFRRTGCDEPGIRAGGGRVCLRGRGSVRFRGDGGKSFLGGAPGLGSDETHVQYGNPFCLDEQTVRERGLRYGPVRVPPAVQVSDAP